MERKVDRRFLREMIYYSCLFELQKEKERKLWVYFIRKERMAFLRE